MALINFSSLKNMIKNNDVDDDKKALFEEVLLLVLARASRVDSNIESIEIRHVQKALKEITGADSLKRRCKLLLLLKYSRLNLFKKHLQRHLASSVPGK